MSADVEFLVKEGEQPASPSKGLAGRLSQPSVCPGRSLNPLSEVGDGTVSRAPLQTLGSLRPFRSLRKRGESQIQTGSPDCLSGALPPPAESSPSLEKLLPSEEARRYDRTHRRVLVASRSKNLFLFYVTAWCRREVDLPLALSTGLPPGSWCPRCPCHSADK